MSKTVRCSKCWDDKDEKDFCNRNGQRIYRECIDCRRERDKVRKQKQRDEQKYKENMLDQLQKDEQKLKKHRTIINYLLHMAGCSCVGCQYNKVMDVIELIANYDHNIDIAISLYIDNPSNETWAEVIRCLENSIPLCIRCVYELEHKMIQLKSSDHIVLNVKINPIYG